MSKTHCIRKSLLLLILVLTFAAPAFADPVEITTTIDDPEKFELVATGGPINNLFQLTLIPRAPTPNGFWQFGLSVAEADFGPFDTIVVLASVQHLINPPGHQDGGAGIPINFPIFVFAFNAAFQGGNMGMVQAAAIFSVVHGQHSDLLRADLIAAVDRSTGSFEITEWTLTIDTIHTPEPATMLLLGTGLAGVAMKMRKRLKGRKSG